MSDLCYYCFECDYGTRSQEKIFIKDCLQNFNPDEITNIGISVNNNIYSLEFYIFLHLDKKIKSKFEAWLSESYPSKYRKLNLFTKDLLLFNVQTFCDEQSVDFAFDNRGIFLFPERQILESLHPQYRRHNMPPRVFLSHSSVDKPTIVEPLYDFLQTQEIDVWLDKYEIDYGDNIYQKVNEGINNAQFAIFVLTENFLNSKWAKEEISAFTELIFNDKSIVIVNVKDKTIIPKMISARKYMEWNEGQCLAELARVIKRKLDI